MKNSVKKFFAKNISLKLVSIIMVLALIVPGTYFIWPPQPAKADFSACASVFASLFATILGSGAASVPVQPTGEDTRTAQSMSDYIENCVEHGIALGLGKIILTAMTNEIVNWINSGFHGSPAFVTNPGSFFENIGDQFAGNIISGTGLASLCSPFSLQEKLALALNFSLSISAGNPQGSASAINQENSCTLSSVLGNATNAVNNFVNDFSQGGWPAYFGISMNAQNNPYGSFLQADAAIQAGIDSQQGIQSQELDWGTGFMSTETCTDDEGNVVDQNDVDDDDGVTCTIDTPGHTIAGVLDKQLGVSTDELGVADDLDKIFNALGYQLVTMTLETGLGTGGAQTYTNSLPEVTASAQAALNASNYSRYQSPAASTEDPLISNLLTAPTSATTTGSTGYPISTAPNSALPSITMNGTNPTIVGVDSTFTDPGYTVEATTNHVIVTEESSGVVNTASAGTYKVTYTAGDSSGTSNTLTRTVIVDNPPTITLNGDNPMSVSFDASYIDPGATAYDDIDGDISSKIVTTGTVGTSAGTYTVTYTVTDSVGLTSTATRTVNVE